MNEKIAMGFHTCVDYELVWNERIVEEQIRKHNIHNKDLEMNIDILSERDISRLYSILCDSSVMAWIFSSIPSGKLRLSSPS